MKMTIKISFDLETWKRIYQFKDFFEVQNVRDKQLLIVGFEGPWYILTANIALLFFFFDGLR